MLGRNHRIGSAAPDPTLTKVGTRRFLCIVCGLVYDESVGDPDGGIPPGTPWEDVPSGWRCPVCHVGKSDFELFGG